MWNVAVRTIQVARTRHQEADAMFSVVSHLNKQSACGAPSV
jgi:hypothetical protein